MQLAYHKNLSRKTRVLNCVRRVFQIPFLERLLIRLTNNQPPSSWLSKLVPSEYLYKTGSERLATISDVKYQLDVSHVVDHFMYFGFRDTAFDNLIRLIKSEDIVVDIGANIGRFSLPFAKAASQGRVYCFEPDLDNFKRLSLNIQLNALENLMIFKKGLGAKASHLKLYKVDIHNPGMNRFLNDYDKDDFHSEIVEVVTLDEQIQEVGLKKLNIIKIDVEGFEFEVLKGATNTIDFFKPLLFVELNNENLMMNGASALEVLHWIESKNYKIYNASSMSVVTDQDLKRQFDALCIPQ